MTSLNLAAKLKSDWHTSVRTDLPWLTLPRARSLRLIAVALLLGSAAGYASEAGDRRDLAALDTAYQQAVRDNDARTMAAILADNFVVVEGSGKRWTKADLIKSATNGSTHYEHQEETEQSVLVFGDTGVVTAKLWVKGLEDGVTVDYKLWFSDVYVRTPTGWRYVFGQASRPLLKSAR